MSTLRRCRLASPRLPRVGAGPGRRDGARAWPACPRSCSGWSTRRRGSSSPSSLFLVALPLWSRVVEGRRAAVDRLVTTLVWVVVRRRDGAAGLAALGGRQERAARDQRGLPDARRCATWSGTSRAASYHALIGTLLITLAATVISVPIGILTAIYLVEYGTGIAARAGDHLPGRRDDRHPVDRGRPVRARRCSCCSSDRRIRSRLRRRRRAVAADDPDRRPLVRGDAPARARRPARGVVRARACRSGARSSRWCCRPSLAGIVTGVVLAISRVIGETAPLLVVAGATDGGQHQPLRRPDDHAARLHLLPVLDLGHARSATSGPGAARSC